ncbi:MAG: VWA domain-containing protein [Oscillospiraceae bacterium]|nr:VWA domain-containing protein [Oscillospiraceae bacterium]
MKRKKYIQAIAVAAAVALFFVSGCAAPGYHSSGQNAVYPYAYNAYPTGEQYLSIDENPFVSTASQASIALSLKIDTAAYSNVERYIQNGQLPPADAVRTEELLNYFQYEQPLAFIGDSPFASYIEIGPSPFDPAKSLAFVRVKTRNLYTAALPPCNFTFLIDISGSMASYDKLPLIQQSLSLLADTLRDQDRLSIVTYAGTSAVVLQNVPGSEKDTIKAAIAGLQAGGSTNGAGGIETAYQLAEDSFMPDGNNRVILATDGDFNVGPSGDDALAALISQKRDSGIYLSILGFGTGNLRDDLMETLSKDGNGNYNYINSLDAARKVLIDEMSATLYTVAKDVKAQVTFNPAAVESYRLIGYENRQLTGEQFQNPATDAGEIGAGADTVMLFEIQFKRSPARGDDLFTLQVHYKDPATNQSRSFSAATTGANISQTPSSDFNFASSVTIFCHLLRGSPYTGQATLAQAETLASESLGADPGGWRAGYMELLRQYGNLMEQQT